MAGDHHLHTHTLLLEAGSKTQVQLVCAILSAYRDGDHYAYEREECWHIGLGRGASLGLDPAGGFITLSAGEVSREQPVGRGFAEAARRFVAEHGKRGGKAFGFASFNYALFSRGLRFEPGRWPLASLLVPRVEVTIQQERVVVTGGEQADVEKIQALVEAAAPAEHGTRDSQSLDSSEGRDKYENSVGKALAAIEQGRISKVIVSRDIPIPGRVDMIATLLRGRAASTPRRTFSFSHAGFQATGFSPELVLSCDRGKVTTEPLAGTRAFTNSEAENQRLRRELENDPKEIREHIMSVKGAMEELGSICSPETVVVEDLMSVRERGRVQHLGSSVAGSLSRDKDAWDALDVVFPSITASGLPKDEALLVVAEIERRPRELYSGAVLFLDDDADVLEATLVLRTVFQDGQGQWVQAGAGIISQSVPRREFDETCEKLGSIAPHVVQLGAGGSA
ncbi:Salicylate synthase [Ophiocordyceps sinensis CO18]|uniref:Salicylate synthase n=1 Tax=Ophiocordyceps sinensis (strain Co18 / CGMCC 3.14243) TaxID=911162 RepID=T5AGB4_OPHSC|nr:Salicylate synthase [Ophiocordyceps sinensis CO18]